MYGTILFLKVPRPNPNFNRNFVLAKCLLSNVNHIAFSSDECLIVPKIKNKFGLNSYDREPLSYYLFTEESKLFKDFLINIYSCPVPIFKKSKICLLYNLGTNYNSGLAFSNCIFSFKYHTTSKLLISPSCLRVKKNSFENEYEDLLQKQKRKASSPLILLINYNEKVQVMTLQNANKLAIEKNLKLVKIEDPEKYTEGNKPVYQLMTGKQHHEESMKIKELKKDKSSITGFKGEKVIVLSSKISDHDLKTKIKNIIQWVLKNYQIKVTIEGAANTTNDQLEAIVSNIENGIEDCGGRVLQKVLKSSGDMKFFINPSRSLPKRNLDEVAPSNPTRSP